MAFGMIGAARDTPLTYLLDSHTDERTHVPPTYLHLRTHSPYPARALLGDVRLEGFAYKRGRMMGTTGYPMYTKRYFFIQGDMLCCTHLLRPSLLTTHYLPLATSSSKAACCATPTLGLARATTP